MIDFKRSRRNNPASGILARRLDKLKLTIIIAQMRDISLNTLIF
jgi:hypothetical protein